MGSCGCKNGMKGGRPCNCANCMRKRGSRSYSAPRLEYVRSPNRIRKINGEDFMLLPLGGNAAREYLGMRLDNQGTFDTKENMRRKATWYRQQGYNARVIELANGHTLWISKNRTLVPTQLDRIKKEFQARYANNKLAGEVAWRDLINSNTSGKVRSQYWLNNRPKSPLFESKGVKVTPQMLDRALGSWLIDVYDKNSGEKIDTIKVPKSVSANEALSLVSEGGLDDEEYFLSPDNDERPMISGAYNRKITPGNDEFDELQAFSADMLMRVEGRPGNARERAILLNEEVVRRQAGAKPQYIFLDYVDYADGIGSSTLEPKVKRMRGTEGQKFYDDMLGVLFPAFWGRSFNEDFINTPRGMQLFDPEWNFVNDGGDPLYRMPNGDMVNTDEEEAKKAGGVLVRSSFVEALREMADAKDGMGMVGYDGYIENVRTGEQLGLDDINARMGGGMTDMGRQFFDTVQSYESGLYGDVMPENYELANYFLSMPSGFESFIVAEPTDRAITGETMITQVGKMGSGVNEVVVSKNVILNDLDTWIQPNDFKEEGSFERWWDSGQGADDMAGDTDPNFDEEPTFNRKYPMKKRIFDSKKKRMGRYPESLMLRSGMSDAEIAKVMRGRREWDRKNEKKKRGYNHPRWFVTPTPPSDVNDGNADGIHDDFQGE